MDETTPVANEEDRKMVSEESLSAVKPFKRAEELEQELKKKDALIQELRNEVAELQGSLKAREVIDKAKCLLIEAGSSEKEAFGRMRKVSMDTRKPLAEVAEAIVIGYKATH